MISFTIAERKEWKTIGYTPVKKTLDFGTVAAIANFTDDYNIFAISNRSTAMLKCVSVHTISSIFCPTLKTALARCRFNFSIDYFKIVTQILKKIFPQIMYHNIHNISKFLVLINFDLSVCFKENYTIPDYEKQSPFYHPFRLSRLSRDE